MLFGGQGASFGAVGHQLRRLRWRGDICGSGTSFMSFGDGRASFAGGGCRLHRLGPVGRHLGVGGVIYVVWGQWGVVCII